ncbi:Threonyl/alanyl tRNA synthetase SAD [Penicillium cf. viridicatum]|uniref:Threonyl/alanyl tRNA synthetase SAD n=1 Tax=Penicillium cf. viridicatum TaxID=2972119 RepID=A0A9W9MKY3_9EURO|nr:Threonyl/alanyl tRNA synthetase SAD [Penicillium cf. viridicatum]
MYRDLWLENECTKAFLKEHGDLKWRCPRADELNCELTFDSKNKARKHADGDHDQLEWPCPRAEELGSEAEDNEVENPEDEEDGDGRDLGSESEDEADDVEDGEDEEDGDHSSESEYDEVEDFEDFEPTAESALAWLGSLPKDQKILKEAAQSEGLHHLGLKCPGPERVVDGLVLGTQVCPHSAIISFETGVFYREGSKYCKKHFVTWKPSPPGEEERRIESQPKIPASEVVNIDIEFTVFSREVLQIGLADMEGNKVLDCLTQYSEGVLAPSFSENHLPVPPTSQQRAQKQKIKAYFTQDGTLNAKEVVEKLQEAGISKNTIFLSWTSWGFDLSYIRKWLEQEGFQDILPGNENVCLLYHEFRANLQRIMGKACHRGRAFPLKLPVVFPLLFSEEDPLSGRNHHALIDARQLCRMAKLFIDLCKPSGQRLGIDKLRSGKRQRRIEEFLSSVSLNKKPRSS